MEGKMKKLNYLKRSEGKFPNISTPTDTKIGETPIYKEKEILKLKNGHAKLITEIFLGYMWPHQKCFLIEETIIRSRGFPLIDQYIFEEGCNAFDGYMEELSQVGIIPTWPK
jgi:hypothetical protein